MKRYEVLIDGRKTRVWAQKIKGILWFHYNGETRSYQPENQYASSSGGGASVTPGKISAPMPGKVMKVSVSEGESVSKGDVVVMMEAMKMEYSLEADISGSIKAVNCGAGDQVSLGQILVDIQSEDDDG